jgi:predicted ribosome-associated RNA-binding protein Tma20
MNYIALREEYERVLTKNEYRIFTQYLDDNYEEMYSNKVGYMVEKIDDKFKVTLSDNTFISFSDIFN